MEGRIIDSVQSIDHKFNNITEKHQIPLIVQAMDSLTSLGSVHLNLIILGMLASFGNNIVAGKMALGLAATWGTIYTLKHLIKRRRPEQHIENVISRASFPSGHSGTAFLTATILSTYLDRTAIFFGLASTVAFSRVYLEDHYPSDAIIGSLIGLIIGLSIVSL